MAVQAPMPSASVSTATAVKPGCLSSWRKANLRSFIFGFTIYDLRDGKSQIPRPTSQTSNTKLQTPEKLQCSSSKPPTSLEELEFGHGDFFGAWILGFG